MLHALSVLPILDTIRLVRLWNEVGAEYVAFIGMRREEPHELKHPTVEPSICFKGMHYVTGDRSRDWSQGDSQALAIRVSDPERNDCPESHLTERLRHTRGNHSGFTHSAESH